jgi:hypothetical protein
LQKSATEHSKKFSRAGFFHFAKSSKTNNSIPTSGSSSLSVGRNQNISRGRDSPEASSQPGTLFRPFVSFAQRNTNTTQGPPVPDAESLNSTARFQTLPP